LIHQGTGESVRDGVQVGVGARLPGVNPGPQPFDQDGAACSTQIRADDWAWRACSQAWVTSGGAPPNRQGRLA